MKELMDLMKKKEKAKMSPEHQSAKMKVLGELRGIANEAISKDIPSLKKVTVAAPDKAGLAEGLDKAEEIVEGEGSMGEMLSDEMDEEEPAAEMSGSSEYEMVSDMAEKLSPEEKQKLIEKLSAE